MFLTRYSFLDPLFRFTLFLGADMAEIVPLMMVLLSPKTVGI